VYEVQATRIPSVGGWLGRFLVGRDVTALVTLDEHHAHQERLAVLGEVAAVVAHELNNPLTAVAMYAQMMGGELPPESPFREHVDVIRRNVETCRRAIRELLDWARSADPRVGDVDVAELVEDVVRFVRPLARRAHVELTASTTLRVPALQADEVQIRQVLVNLAMNAVQAVEGVGHRVRLEASEADEGAPSSSTSWTTGPASRPSGAPASSSPSSRRSRRARGPGSGSRSRAGSSRPRGHARARVRRRREHDVPPAAPRRAMVIRPDAGARAADATVTSCP